jgi:hypothetical protein
MSDDNPRVTAGRAVTAKWRPKKHRFTCGYCGKEHWTARKSQRFCSRSCQARGRVITGTSPYCSITEPEHPLAHSDGTVLVHRKVLYERIGSGPQSCNWCGRRLTWRGSGMEQVFTDHLDADTRNNDPLNLVPSCKTCNTHRSMNPQFRTHCPKGHEKTPENYRPGSNGRGMACRVCARQRYHASKEGCVANGA